MPTTEITQYQLNFWQRIRGNPYIRLMRLHQPTGFLLVLWPALWALAMASYDLLYDWRTYLLFIAGGIAMRSAGCVVNDLWDRKIDAEVARTKTRPLASGEITPQRALLLLAVLLCIGLAVLLCMPQIAIYTGLVFLIPILLYPLAKRATRSPQLVLGFTFNGGALLGWLAIRHEYNPPAFILYAACIFWTLGYDTIYGHQDRVDDEKLGLGSMAILLGRDTRFFVGAFYALFLGLMAVAGFEAGLSVNYYLGLGFAVSQMIWQVRTLNIHNPEDCAHKFCSNGWLGIIVLLSIIAGQFPAL